MDNTPVTLITGTSRGLGKDLAAYYCSKGHFVVGCSRNNVDYKIDNYTHIVADISNEKEVMNLFKYILSKYKKLDNLINNAVSHATLSMPFLLTPYLDILHACDTNFTGTFLVSREAVKLMMKRKYGRIVNITSTTIPDKTEGEILYSASKEAMQTFSDVLAKEVIDYGITVNSVGPSPMIRERYTTDEKLQETINSLTVKDFCYAADIINVIDFFLKKESNRITSQIIYMGGIR